MTTPPPAVAEALERLLKDADWLAQQGSEQDRQCIADVRTLARHIQAGAGPGGERARAIEECAQAAGAVVTKYQDRYADAQTRTRDGEGAAWMTRIERHCLAASRECVTAISALLPAPAPATETEER